MAISSSSLAVELGLCHVQQEVFKNWVQLKENT